MHTESYVGAAGNNRAPSRVHSIRAAVYSVPLTLPSSK